LNAALSQVAEAEQVKKSKKKVVEILGRWKKLIMGVVLQERLKRDYL
jgi:hypothetical protein